MQRIRDAGGGPLEMKRVFEFLPSERLDNGWLGIYAWVHLQNLIALGFVKIDVIKGSRAVVPWPHELPAGLFAGLAPAPGPKTEETRTALYTITDKGRYALDNLESMPNEFTTRN